MSRSPRYTAARANVDRTQSYPLDKAVELMKKTHYAKFIGTVTAHLNITNKREVKPVEVALPFSTGISLRVAIADDTILEQLANGEITFDVLVAKPDMMSKLTKFARLLGPKGLMPNPKNGTVTTDPESKKVALMAGSVVMKTEKGAPLMHIRLGRTDQDNAQLVANLEAILKALGPGTVTRCTIASSMSPGVRVAL